MQFFCIRMTLHLHCLFKNGKKYYFMRKRSHKPLHQIKTAKERIAILFEEAEKVVKKDARLAQRYVTLARKIGMRYNVRLTSLEKRHVCKKCNAYLKAGITSVHKVKNGTVRITCMLCGKTTKLPYK